MGSFRQPGAAPDPGAGGDRRDAGRGARSVRPPGRAEHRVCSGCAAAGRHASASSLPPPPLPTTVPTLDPVRRARPAHAAGRRAPARRRAARPRRRRAVRRAFRPLLRMGRLHAAGRQGVSRAPPAADLPAALITPAPRSLRRRRRAPRARARGPRPPRSSASHAGSRARAARAIATNFASRSPASTATGIASSPRRSHSGAMTPVPMPRSAAASCAGSLRQAVGARGGGDLRRLAGEQRLRAPAVGDLGDRVATSIHAASCSSRSRRAARSARVLDARGRRDEHEPADALGLRERDVQRDPPAHRVARERERSRHEARRRRRRRRHVDRPPRAGGAVPAQVGRQRPVGFAREVPHDLVPAAPGLREAVQQEERLGHPAIMPAGPDTHLLLRAFADELARCGVREACTSPGSRCSPIVLALVRDGAPALPLAHRRALRGLLRGRRGEGAAACRSRSRARRARRPRTSRRR